MSITTMMTDDVVILHPGFTTDNRGNRIKDWSVATAVASKAWITQKETSLAGELVDNREGTSSNWILFLPVGTAIDNLCRVTYGSYTLEVVALPDVAHTPRRIHHLEVTLRLVIG